MSQPTLPQHAPNPGARAAALARAAETYRYTYDGFEGIAGSPDVPKPDHPDTAWAAAIAETLVSILVNAAEVDGDLERSQPDHPRHRELAALVMDLEKGGIKAALDELQKFAEGERTGDLHVDDLGEYDRLFRSIPLPDIAARWQDDLSFARMRVAGPNPMMLHRVGALPEHFAVTPADVARALEVHRSRGIGVGADTLEQALAEGRAFMVDYAALDGFPEGSYPKDVKHCYAPLGLFLSTAEDRTLVPVAIQQGQRPDPAVGVWTPADGTGWMMARNMVQVADGNVHQAVVHLAHTHLVTTPFLLSARRNLSAEHPLARLLRYHHEGTLFINDAANTKLAAPGGGVDAVMAGTIEASRAAAIEGTRSWNFGTAALPLDLAARGLDDPDTLPDCPYRDDGLLLWTAIHDLCEGVVRTYYRSGRDVIEDHELQAFFREAGAAEGGRIAGIPAVDSVPRLVEALTLLVFTPSAQHAAVNFPQLDLMAYVPNMPLAGYAAAPTGREVTAADWRAMLPPLDLAEFQGMLGHLLGSVVHTRLGRYEVGLLGSFLGDRRLEPVRKGFEARLDAIEHLIEVRNQGRVPYRYLLPSRIPQSINI